MGKFWWDSIRTFEYPEMSQQVRHVYEFGPFRLDATERLLLREDQHIPLTPKAFETLLVLVAHGGHVIDKDELMKEVWPNTFVEEVNLAKNISCLRKVLSGDQCEHYIETIPKRGYRFVAGVTEKWDQEMFPVITPAGTKLVPDSGRNTGTSVSIAENGTRHPDTVGFWHSSFQRWIANRVFVPVVFLLLGGLATVIIWLSISGSTARHAIPLLNVFPITSFPGNEEQAAFSPSGNQIAFVWNGEKENNSDIYVKLIGTETPLRLTTNPAPDTDPSWSPDGRYIAFLRQAAEGGGVFLVPSLGGAERKLSDIFPYRPVVIGNTLSYSPDGKLLAAPDKSSQQQPFSVFEISVDSGTKTQLTSPPAGSVGDFFPAFSPDQKTLAFVRSVSIAAADIYLLPLAGGEPKRLTFDNSSIRGLSWTSDSREIIFASRRGGSTYNLWKVSIDDGKPERLTTAEHDVYSPTTSRQGNRLAYTQSLMDGNIWRLPLRNAKAQLEPPSKLISSSQEESGPQYSPDGKKIVFASRRSGSFEIWVCESDGTNPRQLTNVRGPLTGTPRWSPDGRQIAFDSWVDGNADIYLISVEGGQPRRLTFDPDEDITPTWSRDGRSIYFGCTRSGSLQIWRVPVNGGAAVQVTTQGGFEGFESTDGQYFYYSKGRVLPGIWRIPITGGEELPVVEQHHAGMWRYWAVTDEGLYFATAETPSRPEIDFLSFKSGRITQVAKLSVPLSKTDPGLAISPDGQWLCVLQIDESGSDIVMAENFR